MRAKDGAALAERLRGSLTAHGLDIWIDTREIEGGKTWTREIEEGIDRAQVGARVDDRRLVPLGDLPRRAASFFAPREMRLSV